MRCLLVMAGALLLATLPGCGNGEGYAGLVRPPASSDFLPTMRFFYQLELGYRCTVNGTEIDSYRNALVLTEGRATLLGDRCGQGVGSLDLSMVTAPLFSSAFRFAGDAIFEELGVVPPTAPPARETQAYCTTVGSRPSSGEEIRITRVGSATPLGTRTWRQGGLGGSADLGAMARTDGATQRSYTGAAATLTIELAGAAGEHAGLWTSPGSADVAVRCRLP